MGQLSAARRTVRILVSAGEASGDLYAAELVRALQKRLPAVEFFGCAGPRMQQAGVEPVVDARSLSVVGLVEVIAHIPRIYGEFRKLIASSRERRPDIAILTDSPDFHLRVAAKLKAQGVPVVYLVAPQAWAWREGRVSRMRRNISRLLCIFPFEEAFFRERGVDALYIGHPLTRIVKPSASRDEFFTRHGLDPALPLVTILPGSREGEAARHMPVLDEAARRISAAVPVQFRVARPAGRLRNPQPNSRASIQFKGNEIPWIEGETWDAIAHADVALAASGTVTIEAALLGTPMVTFYRVSPLSWRLGRRFVRVPYLTMVNLVAGKRVVPELIQNEMTAETITDEAVRLLRDAEARERMKRELLEVRRLLSTDSEPMEAAADAVETLLRTKRPGRENVHVG
jgi:lipid-A-disaccharide synthase